MPTVTLKATLNNSVHSGDTTYYNNRPQVGYFAVNGKNGEALGFVKWDVSSIPSNATVTDAKVRMNVEYYSDTSSRAIQVRHLLGTWDEVSTNYSNKPAAGATVVNAGTVTPSAVGQWHEFTGLAGLVQSWVDGSVANHGFQFENEPLVSGQLQYRSRVDSANVPAELVVTYNTPPSQPGAFTDPTAGEVHGDTVAYAHGAGSDPDGDLSHYQREYTTNNGGAWTALPTSTATSGTLDSSAWPATTTARLRVRSVDSTGLTSAWTESPTFTIEHNVAPNAPTGLSPSGGTSINKDATQRFSWTFSDPDAGDSPSANEIRYRPSGSTTWTTTAATTTVSYRDFAAGTFAAGDYEWQVRTADAQGVYGPWSTSAFFTAATVPSDVSITAPTNNETIATEDSQVVWSTPSQEAFEARRVADSAGAPDATVVYYTSGIVESTTARNHALTFETNNRDEHVQVRIRRSGLWSSWVSVKVTVSYTPPQTPRITASPRPGNGDVEVVVDSPPLPPGLPTFTRASTAHLDGVEVASGVPRYPYGRNLFPLGVSQGTSGWTASTNATVTLASTEQAWTGGSSVKWTANAAGDSRIYSDYPPGDVVAGATYTASVWVWSSVARDFHARLQYDERNVKALGTIDGSTVAVPAGVWTRVTVTGVAPAGTTALRVYPVAMAAAGGDVFYADGVQVEQGSAATPWRPGGPSAVLVEEGTTNLHYANVANGGEDGTTSGWATGGTNTLASSTDRAWQGARSIKSTYADNQLLAHAPIPTLTASTRYTVTAHVYVPTDWDGGSITLADDGTFSDKTAVDSSESATSVKGQWVRLRWTFTTGADVTGTAVFRTSAAPTVGRFVYVDGVQVEAKGYATSWHPGGATRNAEFLRPPLPTVTPAAGSVELDVNLTHSRIPSNARLFQWRRTTGTNGLLVYRPSPSATDWDVYVTNDAGASSSKRASLVADGIHRFAVTWDPAGVRLYLDGVQQGGAIDASYLPSAFAEVALLSHTAAVDTGGSAHANAPLLGVRLSDRARTAAELADWTAPLTADADTTYLLRFEGDLAYATEYGEFDGTEDYPTPTSTRIYRTGPDGETLIAIVTPDATYYDRTAGAGVAYTYRAVSVGDNGTTTTSTSTAPVDLELAGVWLHPADDPAALRHYPANVDGGAARRTVEQALRRFAGRALPVVEFGEGRTVEVSATLQLTTDAAWQALVDLEGRIVHYRDHAGRRLFGVVALADDATFYGRDVDLEVTAVDYDEAVTP